ncbi:glycosyltransferase, partial [Pseudomonas paraveronii]|uniref:glycosyltransferase n=1 Tax=Pseudomonas paraveronii TaxID=3040598 RepID=UPI002AB25AD4
ALDHKVGGLEVHDLQADEAFRELKAGKYGEMYQYFRAGQGQNLAASSDVMRVALLKKYGGIYLDADDTLTFHVGNVTLKATPNDILMNSPVTYEPADFSGFNTSKFASHADNPLLDEILEEAYERYKANEEWLKSNRAFLSDSSTAAE